MNEGNVLINDTLNILYIAEDYKTCVCVSLLETERDRDRDKDKQKKQHLISSTLSCVDWFYHNRYYYEIYN